MAVTFQPSEPLNNFFNELSNITSKGQYSQQMKLPKPKAPTALQPFSGLPASILNQTYSSPTLGGGPTGGSDLDKLMRAIRKQESGGNYGAVNRDSGAMGGYQIMPFNIAGPGGWDKEALGRDISTQEFMSNPGIQDTIARYKLGQYLNKYGAAGAAAAWYGGPGAVANMHSTKTQTGGYPSIYAYWTSVLNSM